MFKKGLYIFLAVVILFSAYFFTSSPIFKNYALNDAGYEVYTKPYAFSEGIKFIEKGENFSLIFSKYGEGCYVDNSVTAKEIFNSFGGEILFSEQTPNGMSYYGYSKNIKYKTYIKGVKINLHFFEGKEYKKVGSPIIFGSF